MISDFDFDALAGLATDGINKIISGLRLTVSTFDWSYAAGNFSAFLNSLLTGFDFDALAGAASDSINKVASSLRLAINGFDWSYAGTEFANTLNGLISGIDWENLGKLASDGIAKPLAMLRLAVSTFDWSYAASSFAASINGFFSNEQLWADAGAVVSESIKGLFTWGTDFLNGLNIDQIATDVQTTLKNVDWDGIAESIWNFLGTALDKLGELIWKIIFGPDTNSAEFVHEGEERFNELLSQMGIEPITVDIRFGLDLNNPQESEWYTELQQAIQDSLRNGEWTVPIDPSIPPDAVELARQEFVYQWNRQHPEAPIDPTLPDNAGQVIEEEWAEQGADLEAEVDLVEGDVDPEAKKILEYDGRNATTTANLEEGNVKPEAKAIMLFEGRKATTTVNLAEGRSDSEAKKALDASDKNVTVATSLTKNGWTSLAAYVGTAVSVATTLTKNGWTSIGSFVGTAVSVATTLTKNGWTSIGDFVGSVVEVAAKLLPNASAGSATLGDVFGTVFNVASNLTGRTDGSKDLVGVYGESFDTKSKLVDKETRDAKTLTEIYGDFRTKSILTGRNKTDGNAKTLTEIYGDFKTKSILTDKNKTDGDAKTLTEIYGDFKTKSILTGRNKTDEDAKTLTEIYGDFKTKSILTGKAKGSKTVTDVFGKEFTVTAKLSSTIRGLSDFVKTVAGKLKSALEDIWKKITGSATGGVIANGRYRPFAAGGVISGGVARYLEGVPHYAGGTTRAHGTVFVAGEAGPEIMGHINGRTEILNKSQLAQTMYSAVFSAMSQAVSALGTFLSGQLANCTNAVVATLGNLAEMKTIRYHEPVMASGTVLPYDVAAQIARTGADIQNTLDANNEDLIQTIISVIGAQTSAIVAALKANPRQGTAVGGLTAQQVIDDINRRAQMFGESPLLD